MADSLASHFATLASTDRWMLMPFLSTDSSRTQRLHIADSNGTSILSTNPESLSLAALSQALVASNSAIDHLGLGRVIGVHAQYTNGEVVQTAKLEGETGVVATVAGKQVDRSLEVKKIVNVVHTGFQANVDGNEIGQGNTGGRRDENAKLDRPESSSSAAV